MQIFQISTPRAFRVAKILYNILKVSIYRLQKIIKHLLKKVKAAKAFTANQNKEKERRVSWQ